MADARLGGLLLALAWLAVGCTSAADLDELYTRGMKGARADRWQTAMDDLETFTAKACRPPRPDRRCREAFVALGRGNERRGQPARACVAFDTALGLPPHDRDPGVRTDLERAQQQLADAQKELGDPGPVIVRYRDEVTDEYSPRSVTVLIDFAQVFAKDKGVPELRSADYTKLFGGSIAAGAHVLSVEAQHGCRPMEGARCAPSRAYRSWTFDNQSKTPLMLDVRTFAEPGEGDAPAQPTLDMQIH